MTANLQTAPPNANGTQNPGLLPLGEPAYDIHFDTAPTFYLNGQPGPTDPNVRKLERDVGNLTSLDPYVRNAGGAVQSVPLTDALVDTVGERALHMVNADPNRTPTFTWFANPDFFFQLSPPCGSGTASAVAECVSAGFAWNHGNIQPEIGTTWVGMVGPGVDKNGVDSTT